MTSQADSRLKRRIAANLDRGIIAKRLTNRELGERIGKTEHQVWRWRKGRHTPSLETLEALAAQLFDGDITRFYADYTDHDDDKVAA